MNGTCIPHKTDPVCTCNFGWKGEDCSIPNCPSDCNKRGKCDNGVCMCDANWTDLACDKPKCTKDCMNRGRCMMFNICDCEPNYFGG